MSEKIPKLSTKLYQKLAQLLTEMDQKSTPRIVLTQEEKVVHERYFKAFMNGQATAASEQDQDNAA
ncbi:MAG: hypothetical protein M3Q07_12695 [Pseudobdellovibrionaceae bacterium]|nr:hypothetical protein [Pseudobdellovibrionaceae bacterium]